MQHTHRQPARCARTRPPRGEEVTGEKRVTSEGSPEPGARRARCPHPAAQTAPGTGVSEPGPRHGGPLGSASRSGAEGSAPTRYPAAPCLIARRCLLKRKPYRFNRPFIWKYLTFLFFFFFFPPELFDIIVLRVRIKKTKKKKKWSCVTAVDTEWRPFPAGGQVPFPGDSRLRRTGVSVDRLAQ